MAVKKLLFLTNQYPPLHTGGYEELCEEVARGLRARGYEVTILTSDHRAAEVTQKEPGVFRMLHPEVSLMPYEATLDFFFNRERSYHKNLKTLNLFLDMLRPDAVVVWGMWNMDRRLLAHIEAGHGPRVVYYLADYWPSLPNPYVLHFSEPSRRKATALVKKALAKVALAQIKRRGANHQPRFEHVICVSQAIKDALHEAQRIPASAVVIHNGIDPAPFAAAGERRVDYDGSEPFSLLYAGRITPEKGVQTAIEAVSKLFFKGIKVRLTVLGEGRPDYMAKLTALAAELKVGHLVTFAGRVPRGEMPEAFRQYHALVFPSTWPEPLARIAQEAMAAGLLVIGTGVGGMQELLEDGANSLMFPPSDSSTLAEKTEQAIADPEYSRALALAGQQTVLREFTIDCMLERVDAYLQELD